MRSCHVTYECISFVLSLNDRPYSFEVLKIQCHIITSNWWAYYYFFSYIIKLRGRCVANIQKTRHHHL